jgi:hypothetical protein
MRRKGGRDTKGWKGGRRRAGGRTPSLTSLRRASARPRVTGKDHSQAAHLQNQARPENQAQGTPASKHKAQSKAQPPVQAQGSHKQASRGYKRQGSGTVKVPIRAVRRLRA